MSKPKEHTLSLYATPQNVRDIVKATLHTILFHRTFPPTRPYTFDVLDQTISAPDDPQLRNLIDARANDVATRCLSPPSSSSSSTSSTPARLSVSLSLFEKHRQCREKWHLDITLAPPPRTEAERAKVRDAMRRSLRKATLEVLVAATANIDDGASVMVAPTPGPMEGGGSSWPVQIVVENGDGGGKVGEGIGVGDAGRKIVAKARSPLEALRLRGY